MRGYDPATYGDRFADVYDDWYPEVDSTAAAIESLRALAGDGPVLELGAGTGRLAIPLAEAGLGVWALDSSATMLDRLTAKPGGESVNTVVGDMGTALPAGPYSLVYVAVNTFFGLPTADAQAQCIANVAAVLAPGGRFVVAAFVPEEPDSQTAAAAEGTAGAASSIEVRTLTADAVVLSISRIDHASQIAEGQHVELRHGMPVTLRPWSIRYSTPAELDDFALRAGLTLEHRWSDWSGRAFDDASSHHVSSYRRGR